MTPTICTIVVRRYTQSSVSYAEANHAKLIQAHDTANVAKQNPTIPALTWPAARRWASSSAAVPNAITNARSNSSSSGVAVRPRSCGSRPDIVTAVCRTVLSLTRAIVEARQLPSAVARSLRERMPSLR